MNTIGAWTQCTNHNTGIRSLWINAGAGMREVIITYADDTTEVIPLRGVLEYASGAESITWCAETTDGTLSPLPALLQDEVQKVHDRWRASYTLPRCPIHRAERLRCVCVEAIKNRWVAESSV